MNIKETPKLCQQHQQECIAIDRNPKCDPNRRDLCAKCLTTQIKDSKVSLYSDAANELQDIKQEYKRKVETQSKRNIETLKELGAQVIQLANHYSQILDKLSQNINQQIILIEGELERMEQKLKTIDINEYFSKNKSSTEQSDQYIQMKQIIQQQLDKLLQTDAIQNCQSKIQQIDHQVITLYPDDDEIKIASIQEEFDTPHLKLICEEHKKEIILFDLSAQRSKENRIACISCISGSTGTYSEIKDVKNLWDDYEQCEIKMLEEKEEQLKKKFVNIQESFSIFKQKILQKLIEVDSNMSQNQLELENLNQQKRSEFDRDWLKLTKQDILKIADTLSKPKPKKLLEESMDKAFKNQENQINSFVYDTVLSISDAVNKCFEKIDSIVNLKEQGKMNNTEQLPSRPLSLNLLYEKQIQNSKERFVEIYQQESVKSLWVLLTECKMKQLLNDLGHERNENFFLKFYFNQEQAIFILANQAGQCIFQAEGLKFKPIQYIERDDMTELNYFRKQQSIVFGDKNGYLSIWGKRLRKNRLIKFCESQKIKVHENTVNRVITNKNEDLMISCSDDTTIKFCKFEDQKWKITQIINEHKDKVFAISLNDSENQVVSSGNDKQILIIQQDSKQQWQVIQIIKGFGFRLSFVGDQYIAFQPVNGRKMKLYKIKKNKQFKQWKDLPVKKGKKCSIYHSPMIYNKEKQILINTNGQTLYIFKMKNNNEFIVEQTMNFKGCKNMQINSSLTDDGNFLTICDTASLQIQLRECTQ